VELVTCGTLVDLQPRKATLILTSSLFS